MINKIHHVFNKKNLLVIFFALLLSAPSLLPLFHKGFFVTDDGEWMIIRLSAFFAALRDGQIPVRTLGRLNFGYGYPAATFLYPGIMYFGSLIHLFKIGFINSVKITVGISLVGSLVFTYLWLRQFFDKQASLIGSLFYLYLPYHLYDVYVRGSIGEVFALLWVPYILWNIERESIFMSSIGISLLLLSHNTLAMLVIPVISIYMLVRVFSFPEGRKKYLYRNILILVLGICMSAFFLIPAIFELHLTQFSKTSISNPLLYFADINLLGSSIIITSLAVVILFMKNIKYKREVIFFLVMGLLSMFFSSGFSAQFWKIVPASFIQFPFRLLSISILSICFLSAVIISNLKDMYKKFFVIISAVLLLLSAYQYINRVNYTDKGEGFYTTNDSTTTIKDEYMPLWVKDKPVTRPDRKVEISKREGQLTDVLFNNKKVGFQINSPHASNIQINTVYWPGWSAFVDGKKTEILYNNSKGLMHINAPLGKHFVSLIFGEDNLSLTADIVSVISFCLLILIAGRKKLISNYEFY